MFNRPKPQARNVAWLSLATALGEKCPKLTETEFDHLKAGKEIRNLATVKGSSLSPIYKQEANLGAQSKCSRSRGYSDTDVSEAILYVCAQNPSASSCIQFSTNLLLLKHC